MIVNLETDSGNGYAPGWSMLLMMMIEMLFIVTLSLNFTDDIRSR